MTHEKQTVYAPSDVQKLLDVDQSTLRKYAILLEKGGYKFHKNARGHRGYFENDVVALRKLLELNKQEDMTLERSVNAVMTWVRESNITLTVMEDSPLHDGDERYNELISRIEQQEQYLLKQEEFNRQLMEQLQRQDEYNRARDEKLMSLIRETQETKRMIAIAQEQKQEAKKKWYEFWK